MKIVKTFGKKDENLNEYLKQVNDTDVFVSFSPDNITIAYNSDPLQFASLKFLDNQLATITGEKLQAIIDLESCNAVLEKLNAPADLSVDNSELASNIDLMKERKQNAIDQIEASDIKIAFISNLRDKVANGEDITPAPEAPLTKVEDGEVEPVAEATPEEPTEDSMGSGI
ncbi:MAG: hypothetical protein WCH62_09185 [Candidatus Omnitrophota bacterium]